MDADPQCNLTQLALNRTVSSQHGGDFDAFYAGYPAGAPKNLYEALIPLTLGANELRPALLTEIAGDSGRKFFCCPGISEFIFWSMS